MSAWSVRVLHAPHQHWRSAAVFRHTTVTLRDIDRTSLPIVRRVSAFDQACLVAAVAVCRVRSPGNP